MRKVTFFFSVCLIASLVWLPKAAAQNGNKPDEPIQTTFPIPLTPYLSDDRKTLYNGGPVLVVVDDPNPPTSPRRIPAPAGISDHPSAVASSFSITYIPEGDVSVWGEPCYAFPEEAKAAFEYAASIWADILNSNVPITINACWADLDLWVLGCSGGYPLQRDFSGATKSDTWYAGSLANALNGSDLDPSGFDMHIIYNSNVNWYYGTDGNTPSTQHDLVSVILHEICHGLNFSGSMRYSGGSGRWGYDGSPYIYDVFVRDGSGTQLIDTSYYPNGSTALGNALTSNDIWFHGAQAMTANGNQRVKIYAPSTWEPGSSYAHLDYDTFNNTINQLMVYAISEGESIHDPGPVTKGLLADLGWTVGSASNAYVDPSGYCDGNIPCYTTIQAAINAAGTGTTIKIVQGSYYENVTLSTSKQVSLSAGWNVSYTTQLSSSSITSLTRTAGMLIVKKLIIQR